MGNEAQAVCLMVELTRVCEVTIPLWDARDRHCGARLAIAHLPPTIPQQTWFRGVVHCTCHPRWVGGYPRPYTYWSFRVMRDAHGRLTRRSSTSTSRRPNSRSFSCPTRMLCGFPAQEQPRSEQSMAPHYTVVMADAPHTNIPDGTACGVNPAMRTIMAELAFIPSHRWLHATPSNSFEV